MKDIVDTVMSSIAAEVAGANAWTRVKYDPQWRNPDKGPALAVYGNRTRVGGDFRTTGHVEDVHELIVEYWESAGDQAVTLVRNETAELAAYDTVDLLRDWAKAHQAFGAIGVHRFDLIQVDYHPGVRREAFVRYCRLTFEARTVATYA